MMLTRWDPFTNLLSLDREMDRLFGEVFTAPQLPAGNGQSTVVPTYSLPLDLEETENGYRVQATVAGFTPEQVDVSFSDGVLTIRAKKEKETVESEKGYIRRERVSGNLFRQISLPGEVNASDIKASVENGILTIEVPKAAPSKPIKVEVVPAKPEDAKA